MSQKLFSEFPPVSTAQWEEVITKDLKGSDYEKKLIWKSQEGIDVRPYYRAEDLKNLKHLENLPGSFPFVRGTKTDNDWLIRQGYCVHEEYSKANYQAIDGIKKGVESVGFSIDGNNPISVSNMTTLLSGINIEEVEINFEGCGSASPQIISSFIEFIKINEINPNNVRASFDVDPLRTLTQTGKLYDSYKEILLNCIKQVQEYPHIKVINIEAYAFNDAGATIVQELGFAIAQASEYLSIITNAGIEADEAASRMKFTFSVGSNYFMEIAKFRAARILWANVTKEYGVNNEESQKIVVHAVTSQWNMTLYDSYVNMLRATTEAMSAALSGVDSIEVLPFDYAFREPSEFSNRIARNIQIILKDESYFNSIVDPAAGSYYLESLTASVAENSWNLLKYSEEKGGYIESFKSGYIQNEIKTSAQKKDLNIATKREILLGTNQYANLTETADKDIKLDIVTRENPTKKINSDTIAEPLEKYRGAQSFEAIRFATDKSGKRPKVFLLTYGNLSMCRARAQFSSNFFSVAGYEIIDNTQFLNIEEGIKAAVKSKAQIVVACSSDDEYAESVPVIFEKIGEKSIVVVAGDPACKNDLIAKGVDKFINVKSNVLETLKSYQTLLGINQ